MKKIYFAENWGQNTKQIEETFKQQSPNISGVWKNICSTTNIKEADYLVIQDNCREDEARFFAPDKRLYFSREAMDSESIKKYPRDQYNHFSYWNDTGIYGLSGYILVKTIMALVKIMMNLLKKSLTSIRKISYFPVFRVTND